MYRVSNELSYWQTRTHCCGNIVAHDVSLRAQTGKHLLRTQNVSEQNQKHFCVPDTKFVSATNVARAGKRGNICVGNNVSATMCPRLPVPYTNTSGSLGEREMLWDCFQFRVLPNFHECLYNSIETRSTCFLFLLENSTTRRRKTTC